CIAAVCLEVKGATRVAFDAVDPLTGLPVVAGVETKRHSIAAVTAAAVANVDRIGVGTEPCGAPAHMTAEIKTGPSQRHRRRGFHDRPQIRRQSRSSQRGRNGNNGGTRQKLLTHQVFLTAYHGCGCQLAPIRMTPTFLTFMVAISVLSAINESLPPLPPNM